MREYCTPIRVHPTSTVAVEWLHSNLLQGARTYLWSFSSFFFSCLLKSFLFLLPFFFFFLQSFLFDLFLKFFLFFFFKSLLLGFLLCLLTSPFFFLLLLSLFFSFSSLLWKNEVEGNVEIYFRGFTLKRLVVSSGKPKRRKIGRVNFSFKITEIQVNWLLPFRIRSCSANFSASCLSLSASTALIFSS